MKNPYKTLTKIADKKQVLIELSKPYRARKRAGIIDMTINECLIDYYSGDEQLEWHSYKQWLELGKKVIKGEKGWCIWSKPILVKITVENEKETDDFTYYRVAYIFNNKQVEAIK